MQVISKLSYMRIEKHDLLKLISFERFKFEKNLYHLISCKNKKGFLQNFKDLESFQSKYKGLSK